MADIKINKDTGELAIADPSGGYRLYKRNEYKLDAGNSRVAIPDATGFVMYDLPKPAGPLFKDPGRSFMLGTRQSIEGLLSPVTMLGDVTNSLVNLPIKGANKLFGTSIAEFGMPSQGLNRTLVEDAGFPTEQNDTERLVGAGVKGAGGAIATMGAGAIPALTRAAPAAAATLRANPAVQAIGGTTGGVAAEGTRQGLQDTQIFENPTADAVAKSFITLASGVLGGLGGFGAARALDTTARGALGTLQATTNILTKAGKEKIAGQMLRQASGSPRTLYARLADADAVSPVPGVRPTTAQALGGDSQLSGLELAMRNDPAYRHAFDIRAAENQTARTASLDALSPAGAGNVDDLAAGIKAAWSQADETGQRAILEAHQRAQQRIAALGDTVDPQAAGQVIREELQTAYGSAKGRTGAAYRGIDPQGTSSFPGTAVYDRVAPLIEQYFANSTAGTPPELLPILHRLRNSPTLPFKQIDAIRSDLGDIAGKAAQSGDNRLSSVAGQMADEIGAYTDEAAAAGQGFSPEQATAYQGARELRRQQGQTFERGAVGAALKRGPFGEFRTPESGVTAKLFFRGPGSPEATAQFIRAAGGQSRAAKALGDHIATQLRQSVTRPDGAIDSNRLMKFISDHGGALRSFPELRQRIGSVAEAQAMADRAALQETARRAELSGSPLNQFLTKNPADAVAAIMMGKNSENAAQHVMRQLQGNTASLAAFKRSVVDWFKGSIENAGIQPVSGDPLQSFAKMKTILDSKLPTLRQIFNEAEIKALRQFAKQMETEARVTGARPMGSNTFANLASRYLVERGTAGHVPMGGATPSPIPGLGWLTRPIDESIRQNIMTGLLDPDAALRMVGAAAPLPIRDASAGLMNLLRGAGLQTGMQAQGGMQRQNTSPGLMAPRPEPAGLMIRPGR